MRGTARRRSAATTGGQRAGTRQHLARITAVALVLSTATFLTRIATVNANPGDLDSTWGANGISLLNTATGSSDEILAEVIDSTGKLVVAGQTVPSGGVQKAFIARYNSSGALDTTFGTNGVTVTQFGNSGGDSIRGLVLEGTNIVAVGQRNDSVVISGITHIHTAMAVARYTSAGALDTTFGTGGVATIDVGDHADFGQAIALDPTTGKIVAIGSDKIGWLIARLTTGGALDSAFNASGSTIPAGFTTPPGTVEMDWSTDPANPGCSGADNGMTVAVQTNSMVVAGGYDQGTCSSSTGDFGIARILSDGSGLDTSFGTSGKNTADFGGFDFPFAMLADGNGGAGTTYLMVGRGGTGVDFALARFTLSGALDSSFNSTGKQQTDFGSTDDEARAVAEQSDGRYVVAGFKQTSGGTSDFALARYNHNGSLDTTNWQATGKLTTNLQTNGLGGSSDEAHAIVMEPGILGKIIVGGFSVPDGGSIASMATVRYFAAYPPVISQNPANQTVCVGDPAAFTAAATTDARETQSPPITQQWQSEPSGGSFSNISGATSGTYLIGSTTAIMNGNQYRSQFTNSGGTTTGNAATLTVNIPPSTTLNPSNDSVFTNEQVSFTATASGRPTPTVQWQVSTDNGSTFNNVGGATSTTYSFTPASTSAALALDGNQYRAVFTNSCGTATTSVATLTETQPATGTSVASSANPSVSGQPVTFTATVTKTSGPPGPTHVPPGTPSGTVSFYLGSASTPFDTETLVWNTTSGTATSAALTGLTVAGQPYTIKAVYSGDSVFLGSNGTVSQQVDQDPSSTVLSPLSPTTVFGQSQQFSATVSSTTPGAGTPTGSVTFKFDGGTTTQDGTLSTGSTSVTNPGLSVGSHPVVAHYNGDTEFASSDSATGSWTVDKAATTTTAQSGLNPADAFAPVTFTATVSVTSPGAGTPTGTVNFYDNGTTLIDSATLQPDGTAQVTESNLASGHHSITAQYSGDGDFDSSVSSPGIDQVINPIATTTTVSTSDAGAVTGEALTFTATVIPNSGTHIPTGSVQFLVDGSNFGAPVSLNPSGVATIGDSALTAVGSPHTITADYLGDSHFSTSNGSYSQTVGAADTTTTVASSVNPSVSGQGVKFTATVAAVSPGGGTPTGSVTFYIDGAPFGTAVTLSGGQATSNSTSSLSVTGHSVEADYTNDNANYGTSTDTITQIVNPAESSTAVVLNTNPSVFGQPVTFTATVSAVSPGSGTPTGTVHFTVDGNPVGGDVTLSGGTATSAPVSDMPVGTHAISAVYSGDTDFGSSTADAVTQTVDKAATTITLQTLPTTSVYGQEVQLSAQVTVTSPGAGTPTGLVTFVADGSNTLGATSLAPDGTAVITVSSLAVGSHSIVAQYAGDSSFVGSNSASAGEQVNQDGSTTAVVSSANPSVYGQAVTFMATVTADAPGSGTPTGSVQFSIDGTPFGTVSLSGGSATSPSMPTTDAGSHSVVASYLGDTNFFSSSDLISQQINAADTSTTVGSTPNPSVTGQSVTLTATVSTVSPGSGTPLGTVQFSVDGSPVGSSALSGGTATFGPVTFTSAGNHSIGAVYQPGNGDFNGSNNSGTQTVNQADTTTSVTSDVNPTVYGQGTTFTAQVTTSAPGSGIPQGNVQFVIDGNPFGSPVPLDGSGAASLGPVTTLGTGGHTVVAQYLGDPDYNSSNSGSYSQTVNKADTQTFLQSYVNPSVFGQTVSFQATVTAVAPGAGIPTGTVTFTDGGSPVDTESLDASGNASFATATLAVGPHTIQAFYSSDPNFNASPSNQVSQQVNKADTNTSVASSANPSIYLNSVTFTATVTAVSPGDGTPAGTVQWVVDGSNAGSPVALDASGHATLTTSSLSVGNHTVEADYGGNGSYNISSGSLAGGQTVEQAVTTTTISSSANPSFSGQAVTFKAHVSGSGTPTGPVQFLIDGSNFGAPVNINASGDATSGSISTLSVGNHTVEADYGGDPSHLPSSDSMTQQVTKASTTTALVSSANPSNFGQSVTFTATVAAVAPATGTPTGTVTFTVNGTTWSTQSLSGGTASYTTTALPPGTLAVVATYSGDTNFLGSSKTVNQTVKFSSTSCLTTVKNGLTVSSGQAVCIAGTSRTFASVKGGITVRPGGALFISFATVQGGILSNGAAAFRMCDSSSGSGSISVTGSTGAVVIGDKKGGDDGSPTCGGNSVNGGLTVSGNSGGVEIGGTTVSGGMTVNNNTGPSSPDASATEIEGNTVGGGLGCSANSPAPTNDGSANKLISGTRSGQCSSSTF